MRILHVGPVSHPPCLLGLADARPAPCQLLRCLDEATGMARALPSDLLGAVIPRATSLIEELRHPSPLTESVRESPVG